MDANNPVEHPSGAGAEKKPKLTPAEELHNKLEAAAERQKLREERLEKIERISTVAACILLCAGFMYGIWAYTHAFLQKHVCKNIVAFDSAPVIQYDAGRACLEAPITCNPLGNDAYWMSIPAAIAISCIMLAIFATVAFIFTVVNMEYVEKLGNMSPKWQRPYLGSLAILGVIFAASTLMTFIGFAHTVIAPYGLF